MAYELQKRRLAGAAAIAMSSHIFSRITGFIRSMAIPNFLPSGTSDAFNLSFRITDFMFSLLVGGAISAALIPVLSAYLAKDDEEEGWKAVSTFINVVFVLMIFACTLGMIFSKEIVNWMWHAYSQQTRDTAVPLVRILFPSVGFMMLAGLTNGVLNSYQRFAAAAYGPSLYNLGSAASILLLGRFGVKTAVFGIACSAFLYFVFQLSFALKNMKYYRFKFFWKHSGSNRLFGLAIPSLAASSVMQVNVLISAYFAGYYVKLSMTAYAMANDVWQMPFGIFAVGIGQAFLPSLSQKLALGEITAYKSIFTKGVNMILFLTIPSGMAFISLNVPIMNAIYRWSSKMDPTLIPLSSGILTFFSIAVVFQSMVAILNRGFYANNDTKTPLFIGTSTILVTALLNLIFKQYTNLMTNGMSLAYSIASILNVILLLFFLNKKKMGMDLKRLSRQFLKVLAAASIMGLVLHFLNGFLTLPAAQTIHAAMKVKMLGILLMEIVVGVVVFFAAALLLKIPEAIYILDIIKERIKKYSQSLLKIFNKKR